MGFKPPFMLLLATCLAGCGLGVPDNAYQAPPPPEVTVTHPVQQTVTVFIEENGETEVVERADVRARVRGFLEEIKFKPGQKVNQDDVLYVIQRSEYQAALNSATAALDAAAAAVEVSQAQVGVVEVELTRAELEFTRYEALLSKEAVTQSQFDQILADRDAARANHEAAKAASTAAQAGRDQASANLEQAQLDFDYTLVKAPISGRITKTEIKRGNLVEDGSLMATIVDRDRIYANFNVSDRSLLRLQKAAQERGETREPEKDRYRELKAELRRELDEGFPFIGQLDYVDQEGVDQATGTFAIRAVFDNPEDLILPGLFVRVRVPIGQLEDALLIPERALSRDQRGTFVLIVDDEQKVQRRTVTAGQANEDMIVIETGLETSDLVLVDGGQRARPGIVVNPVMIEPSAPADPSEADTNTTLPPDDADTPTIDGEAPQPAEQP